jgi:hypothetical protein
MELDKECEIDKIIWLLVVGIFIVEQGQLI